MFLLFVLSGSAPVAVFPLVSDSKSQPQRCVSDFLMNYPEKKKKFH